MGIVNEGLIRALKFISYIFLSSNRNMQLLININ